MANPVVVPTPAGAWTLVATNVTNGYVHVLDKVPNYLQTYRITGQAAPVSKSEGAELNFPGDVIRSTFGIDVYVWAIGAAGKVRVDAL